MTILQTLVQLRDDIKLWCINNFSSINKKITTNTESIESVQTELSGKANISHNHDAMYYTETEIDSKLLGKADLDHDHDAEDITSGTLSSDRLPVVPVSKGGTGCSTYRQARAKINNFDLYCVRTLNNLWDSDISYVWQITSISSPNYANVFLVVLEDPDGYMLGAGTYILGSQSIACGAYTVRISELPSTASRAASGDLIEDYFASGAGEGGAESWIAMVSYQTALTADGVMKGDFLSDSGYSLKFYEMGVLPGI